MNRLSREKINSEIQALNNTLDQLNLNDIYRAFHTQKIDITIFSSAHGTFSRMIKTWATNQDSVNKKEKKK